jgi:hypothetical protein
MFSLNGDPSPSAIVANAILKNSGLETRPDRDDSVAITLYRVDPVTRYQYLTAMVGVREKEPMFGPLRPPTDFRLRLAEPAPPDKWGFGAREGVSWVESLREKFWHLYVSGRQKASQDEAEQCIRELRKELEQVLSHESFISSQRSGEPLFPELLYEEYTVRDELRQIIHGCKPGTGMEEKAALITTHLMQSFVQLMGPNVYLGIYLYTGAGWELCGSNAINPWICDKIDNRVEGNAFAWVNDSTRPVLINRDVSKQWQDRLTSCNLGFGSLLDDPNFGSLCLVPILYGPREGRAPFGIMQLTSRFTPLFPAHLFLLSRFSFAVSGYLFSSWRLTGFPWWRDAKLGRGGAIVRVAEHPENSPINFPPSLRLIAEEVASDVMPTGSRVTLSPLRSGHSGAHIFRLDVLDEGGVAEVPRVLKIGPRSKIREELRAYFKYVHNKVLGSDARIDIARSSVWLVDGSKTEMVNNEPLEAVVYTFVGAGDSAIPWSRWCSNVNQAELKQGLNLLWERLQSWYRRTRQAEGPLPNVIQLMIEPLARGKLKDYLREGTQTVPTMTEVQSFIDRLYETRIVHQTCTTCIVHGDLHADNLFAVLNSKHHIKSVALIDLGNVRSGWHPLSDISRLMVDIAYRVRTNAETQKLCDDVVYQWGKELGCSTNDWAVVLIHQIAKIMFYQADSSGQPLILPDAREAAWKKMRRLGEIVVGTSSAKAGGT